ncbi:hypothetical protein AB0K08_07435 [Citricoccus sp. NPDC055426]|uniref:hypothetical protein n=1 Tax=Citricoccus sp. NPDC055426 TaxID=3155536 RepID=UPI003413B4AC
MSDPKNTPGTTSETITVTKTVTTNDAEVANRLVADATKAQVQHDSDDARADDWGQASFPASDPPQNY